MAKDEHTQAPKGVEPPTASDLAPDAEPGAPVPWAVPKAAPKSTDAARAGDNLKRPPRLNIEVEVSLESENTFYTGLTQNISEGGLFVATYDLRPVGTEFNVTLTLEGMPPIEARAQVRWIRDTHAASRDHAVGMGMQFSELSEEDRATIQAFLECRIPLYMEGV